MCCQACGWAAWILFASDFKYDTTFVAFWIFMPLSLICSFLISRFNKALTPSTSPFPCPVAKKFQINWHPLGWSLNVVKLGYRDTKYHAHACSCTFKLARTPIYPHKHVVLECTFHSTNDCSKAWKHVGHINNHDLGHSKHSNGHLWWY